MAVAPCFFVASGPTILSVCRQLKGGLVKVAVQKIQNELYAVNIKWPYNKLQGDNVLAS